MKRRLYLVETRAGRAARSWRIAWPALAFAVFTVTVCVLAGWLIASWA